VNLKIIAAIPFLFLAFLSSSYAAGWSVKSEVDLMTNERMRQAQTVNASGHSLQVYRLNDGAKAISFRLSEQSPDVFGDKAPMMRVDKMKPFDFELIVDLDRMKRVTFNRSSIVVTYRAEPKWFSAVVYMGKNIPARGPIHDLVTGKNVVVRYSLSTGEYKETSFSLDGANEAITEAIK